jgi:hypothetical protein
VSTPTAVKTAPAVWRCSALSRLEINRAMPAPSRTRVPAIRMSSGMVRVVVFISILPSCDVQANYAILVSNAFAFSAEVSAKGAAFIMSLG